MNNDISKQSLHSGKLVKNFILWILSPCWLSCCASFCFYDIVEIEQRTKVSNRQIERKINKNYGLHNYHNFPSNCFQNISYKKFVFILRLWVNTQDVGKHVLLSELIEFAEISTTLNKNAAKAGECRCCVWLLHGHVVFKSSIFVVEKATAPNNRVEFRQGSIGTIRSSLATSYDVWQRRQFSTNQRPRNYLTLTDWQRINILSGPALQAAPSKTIYYRQRLSLVVYHQSPSSKFSNVDFQERTPSIKEGQSLPSWVVGGNKEIWMLTLFKLNF